MAGGVRDSNVRHVKAERVSSPASAISWPGSDSITCALQYIQVSIIASHHAFRGLYPPAGEFNIFIVEDPSVLGSCSLADEC